MLGPEGLLRDGQRALEEPLSLGVAALGTYCYPLPPTMPQASSWRKKVAGAPSALRQALADGAVAQRRAIVGDVEPGDALGVECMGGRHQDIRANIHNCSAFRCLTDKLYSAGRFVLKMSTATFHVPPTFFQMTMYLPLSVTRPLSVSKANVYQP